jgi:hypothetical protein
VKRYRATIRPTPEASSHDQENEVQLEKMEIFFTIGDHCDTHPQAVVDGTVTDLHISQHVMSPVVEEIDPNGIPVQPRH